MWHVVKMMNWYLIILLLLVYWHCQVDCCIVHGLRRERGQKKSTWLATGFFTSREAIVLKENLSYYSEHLSRGSSRVGDR